jgi:gamma-glutamylcyclotransferase (GGCT)/AIG2-like uncharacterized protein YtfP
VKGEWVFAYGSSMNTEDLHRWLTGHGRSTEGILQAAAASLPGYRMAWNYRSRMRRGGAANLRTAPGREMFGVALQVDEPTLLALDAKEGHPEIYSRGERQLAVRLRDGTEIQAWVYLVVPERCSERGEWPRKEYLRLVVEGAREHGLPAWHVRELEVTPTLD